MDFPWRPASPNLVPAHTLPKQLLPFHTQQATSVGNSVSPKATPALPHLEQQQPASQPAIPGPALSTRVPTVVTVSYCNQPGWGPAPPTCMSTAAMTQSPQEGTAGHTGDNPGVPSSGDQGELCYWILIGSFCTRPLLSTVGDRADYLIHRNKHREPDKMRRQKNVFQMNNNDSNTKTQKKN